MTDHQRFMLDCLAGALAKHGHVTTAIAMAELQVGDYAARLYMHRLAEAGEAVRYEIGCAIYLCAEGDIPEGATPVHTTRKHVVMTEREALRILREGVAAAGHVDSADAAELLNMCDPVSRRWMRLLSEQHGYEMVRKPGERMRVVTVDAPPLTLTDRVMDLVRKGPRRLQHCERELPDENVESVRSAWARLRGRGMIKPVGGRFYVEAT